MFTSMTWRVAGLFVYGGVPESHRIGRNCVKFGVTPGTKVKSIPLLCGGGGAVGRMRTLDSRGAPNTPSTTHCDSSPAPSRASTCVALYRIQYEYPVVFALLAYTFNAIKCQFIKDVICKHISVLNLYAIFLDANANKAGNRIDYNLRGSVVVDAPDIVFNDGFVTLTNDISIVVDVRRA